MSRKCGKAANSVVVEAQLRCGWRDCDAKFALDQFSELKQHVHTHVKYLLDDRYRNESNMDSQSSTNFTSCHDHVHNGEPERLACSWWECNAQFHAERVGVGNESATDHDHEEQWMKLANQLVMHMSIHIYHARLMAIGEQHIEKERAKAGLPVDCKLTRSCGGIFTQLQRTGWLDTEKTAFRCGWLACEFETRSIYTFFSHVASHADNDESTSSGVSECETAKRPRGQTDSSAAKTVRRLVCGWTGCSQTATVGDNLLTATKVAQDVQDGRTFTNAYRLVEHLRTHTGERVAACSRCGAAFSSLTKLRDHFYAQLGKQPAGVDKPETAQFGCTVCTKRFAKERLLRDHIRKHLNMFKCARCGLTCTSSSSVRRHIVAVHLRRGDCDSESPAEAEGGKRRTVRCAPDAEAAGSQSEADCDSVTSSLPELSESGTDSDTESASASAASSKRRKTTTTTKRARPEAASRRVFECHLCAPAPTNDRSAATQAETLGKCARGADGRFLARDAGQFRFLRGAHLTHHLMVAHAIDYPAGHRRFRYSRDADGVFRLSAVRYETELLTTVDVDEAGQVAVLDHGAAPRSPAASSTSASVTVSATASAAPCEAKPAADDEGASEDDDGSETESSDGSSGSLGSLLESASDRFCDGTASVDVKGRDPFRLDFDEVGSQITFTYDESEYD